MNPDDSYFIGRFSIKDINAPGEVTTPSDHKNMNPKVIICYSPKYTTQMNSIVTIDLTLGGFATKFYRKQDNNIWYSYMDPNFIAIYYEDTSFYDHMGIYRVCGHILFNKNDYQETISLHTLMYKNIPEYVDIVYYRLCAIMNRHRTYAELDSLNDAILLGHDRITKIDNSKVIGSSVY